MNDYEKLRLERHYQTEKLREEAFYQRKRLEEESFYHRKKFENNNTGSSADLIHIALAVGTLIYAYITLLC
ncbi:MAG: hypothetical protein ACRCX8_08695 [Sarcina sp.]